MSKTLSATPPFPAVTAGAREPGMTPRVLALYCLATIGLLLALSLPFASDYVGSDNDDTMRLVMVRDLLAGQGWFDMTQYRLGLAGGTFMHWSRLVDLPIANLVGFFSLFTDRPQAEALALAVWPPLLAVPVLWGMGLAAFRLGGAAAMHATLVLTAILIVSLNRFQPGAIDHHNVQLALVAVIAAMLLDPARSARDHAVAGIACGLAIAVGAETTPLIAAFCLVVTLRWAWRGPDFSHAAAGFGLALAGTATACFFATVPPSHYGQVTCDSLSYGFYALATFGGGLLFLAAALASRLTLRGRATALTGAGAVLAAAVLAIAPGCLGNPLDTLDPLLVTFWLSGVVEAQSAFAQFRLDPGSLGGFYGAGILALLVCLWRVRRGEAVEAHLMLLLPLAISLMVAFVQIRGAIFPNLLSALPLGLLVADLRKAANAEPKNLRRALAFFGLTLASVPPAWALAGTALPGPSRQMLAAGMAAAAPRSSCIGEAAMAALAAEPVGVVAAASELGAPILRHTGHRVLSAPYHRNQGGMLTELHIGLSRPDQAEAFLRGAGVTLLAFCPTDAQTQSLANAEPQGLYAGLFKGEVPDYLEPVSEEGLKLYRVRPGG